MRVALADIDRALAPLGLILRGGFHPAAADAVPGVESGEATLLLVGNAGRAMWAAFDLAWPAARRARERHPLNTWTREVISPIAARCGARVVYPNDGPPYPPFQRWAVKAEGLRPSPLGTLLHPRYGQWHAYRAALLFDSRIAVAVPLPTPDLCAECRDLPCLSSCPVNAFRVGDYDVLACAGHLVESGGSNCMTGGCLARRACPVGREHLYSPPHAQFHMEKFRLSQMEADRV
jgi:hypothetical protein